VKTCRAGEIADERVSAVDQQGRAQHLSHPPITIIS